MISRFRPAQGAQAPRGGNRCVVPKGWKGQTFSVDGVDLSDVLNVRVDPDWRSEVLGKLAPGTGGVIGLGERQRVGTATWRKIACGSVHGWVNEKFLEPETAAR
jgi:hypothetical protein